MAVDLPVPGSDTDNWGEKLNAVIRQVAADAALAIQTAATSSAMAGQLASALPASVAATGNADAAAANANAAAAQARSAAQSIIPAYLAQSALDATYASVTALAQNSTNDRAYADGKASAAQSAAVSAATTAAATDATSKANAAQSAAATDATSKANAAQAAAIAASATPNPQCSLIYVGGLLAGYKEMNADGSVFNVGTLTYSGDALVSLVTSNPARTYTFSNANGVPTGVVVS